MTKELNQADYKMTIIEDLGITYGVHYANFRCQECNRIVKMDANNRVTKKADKCRFCRQKKTRTGGNVNISISITYDFHEKLYSTAKKEGMSRGKLIEVLLSDVI